MSRITIHNYEAFLLDMAEGTITPNDHAELMLFLAAHPELDVELDGIAYATLEADGIHFPDKEILKKTPADTTRFDELACKQLEEKLTTAEEIELQKLVAANSNLVVQLKAYSLTKLQPDHNITFENKGALKHEAVVKPLYYVVAAAASIALLVGAFFLFNNQDAAQNGLSAYKNIELPRPVVTTATNNVASVEAPVKQKKIAAPNTNNVAIYQPLQQPNNITPVVVAPEKQTLVAIANTPVNLLVAATLPESEVALAYRIPVPYFEIPDEEEKPGLLAGLWANAKGLLKKSVKDDEISARIDTVSERGFKWGDLAFIGSKGIEKITGKKPAIGASIKGDGSSSAFNIGRYTIVTRTKNKQ